MISEKRVAILDVLCWLLVIMTGVVPHIMTDASTQIMDTQGGYIPLINSSPALEMLKF